MTDDQKKDPSSRMRTLLAGGEKRPARGNVSPLSRLPKKMPTPSLPTAEADQSSQQESQQPAPVSKSPRPRFGPAFWTFTGIFSLAINGILLVVLGRLLLDIRELQSSNKTSMDSRLLAGLYTNFEKMDRAHIRTEMPVQTTLPVKFDLQLNQQTNVVLTQDVTIDNALVTVQTGGLNITRARTTIVLPQGTSLPVLLNLTVPVDTSVPVTLNVPVDIPLNQTDLHDPILGFLAVLEPFYCMIQPDALNLDGQPICE